MPENLELARRARTDIFGYSVYFLEIHATDLLAFSEVKMGGGLWGTRDPPQIDFAIIFDVLVGGTSNFADLLRRPIESFFTCLGIITTPDRRNLTS